MLFSMFFNITLHQSNKGLLHLKTFSINTLHISLPASNTITVKM